MTFHLVSHEWICGNAFKSLCRHVMDQSGVIDPMAVEEGDLIFVKGSHLYRFFLEVHPKIACRYVLFSHNYPIETPGSFSRFVQDPKLIAWFGSNLTMDHPKLFLLPLGIQNPDPWTSRDASLEKWHQLSQSIEKPFLLYLNFSDQTSSDRNRIRKLFESSSFCVSSPRKPFDQYFQDLAKSRFVLSPRGIGIDCFRTWEAILMGAIPIVQTSPLDRLFEGLPVLIVNEWEEITEEFLLENERKMRARPIDWDKLRPESWITVLRQILLEFHK